jgi:hypothetical protein
MLGMRRDSSPMCQKAHEPRIQNKLEKIQKCCTDRPAYKIVASGVDNEAELVPLGKFNTLYNGIGIGGKDGVLREEANGVRVGVANWGTGLGSSKVKFVDIVVLKGPGDYGDNGLVGTSIDSIGRWNGKETICPAGVGPSLLLSAISSAQHCRCYPQAIDLILLPLGIKPRGWTKK